MKQLLYILTLSVLLGCGASKKIKTGAAVIHNDTVFNNDEEMMEKAVELLQEDSEIPFNTFSAKVKVDYEDMYGKQPEANAFVRMKTGEYIWISITATFLNVEAARVWITPDSIVVINKLEKTIQSRPLGFINDYVSLPFSFNDLQNIIAGKVIFAGDSIRNLASADKFLRISTLQPQVENDIYFTLPSLLLARQDLNVKDKLESYRAEILFNEYEKSAVGYFSTYRYISVPANQQKVSLLFRQYEFNKELSVPFNRPAGYTIK